MVRRSHTLAHHTSFVSIPESLSTPCPSDDGLRLGKFMLRDYRRSSLSLPRDQTPPLPRTSNSGSETEREIPPPRAAKRRRGMYSVTGHQLRRLKPLHPVRGPDHDKDIDLAAMFRLCPLRLCHQLGHRQRRRPSSPVHCPR